jgi:hypothetical protein
MRKTQLSAVGTTHSEHYLYFAMGTGNWVQRLSELAEPAAVAQIAGQLFQPLLVALVYFGEANSHPHPGNGTAHDAFGPELEILYSQK